MKLVGEVTQLNRDRSRPIHLIVCETKTTKKMSLNFVFFSKGIATWGCVAEVTKLDGKGVNVQYTKPTITRRGFAPIDPNHTHFIFVDDGTQAKFGGEISFRARLEHALSGGSETMNRSNELPENGSSNSDVSSGQTFHLFIYNVFNSNSFCFV